MSAPPSPRNVELWTYRALCLTGGLALPVTAYLFERVDAELIDPLWLRLLLGSLPLGLFLGSFVSAQVRRELGNLATVLLYVLVAWFTAIALINGLPAEYAVAGLVLIVAVGVVSGAGDARLRSLAAALVTTAAAMVIVGALAADPGVDRLIFAGSVVSAALALYASSWMQQRLRRQLRLSEERYRTVFERVAEGIALAHADSLEIVASNAAYRRITGYSRQDLASRSLYDLLDGRADEIDVHVRRAMQEGSADVGERNHMRSDGSGIPVELGLTRLPAEAGDLVAVTLRDLTEANRVRAQIGLARDQAQTMLELRTAFLNNMSHEIRTPLLSLTGFLRILEEDPDGIDAEDRADMLGSLRRSADRLNETLNAVLDLAHIEDGQYHLFFEPVDVFEVAESVVANYLPMAAEKGLALDFQTGDPVRILADCEALRRVIGNLLSNAVKFTPSGTITVAVQADSHRVFVHIRDTGVGIDSTFLPYLFNAFQQASTGLSREHEGCGLGLTITKRLLDIMGGRIRVETEPGEGTWVTLVFARTWATTEETEAPSRFRPSDNGDGAQTAAVPAWNSSADVEPLAPRPRALIVEDNADTARLMKRMMSDAFDADVASGAENAIDRARAAWYDIVLIDVHLRGTTDGAALLGRLRAMSAYAHVPAVAISTQAPGADGARLRTAGFDAYLEKPFTKAQLLKTAERAHAARVAASCA